MSERAVITGLGVVSSLGCELNEFWSNLVAGESGISRVTSFDTSGLERHYAGEVQNFNPSIPCLDLDMANLPRTHQFALSSVYAALVDSGCQEIKNAGVILGSLVGGMEFIEGRTRDFNNYPVHSISASICSLLGLAGGDFMLSGACGAGNYALSLAYERIKRGQEQFIATCGADYFSMSIFLSFYKLFALAALKCQPFDKNRRGLLPAEGAGTLIVESLSSAKQRKAHIYAEILGYGFSADAYHPVIPLEEGVYNCMENALGLAGLEPGDVDYISAHGTGTPPNDRTEAKAIKRLFGQKHYKKIAVSSIKSMLGHAMGAASSLEAISCCLAINKGVIPPTINYETFDPECDIDCVPNKARQQKVKIVLNNSFGFGGMNCSLVLAAP